MTCHSKEGVAYVDGKEKQAFPRASQDDFAWNFFLPSHTSQMESQESKLFEWCRQRTVNFEGVKITELVDSFVDGLGIFTFLLVHCF